MAVYCISYDLSSKNYQPLIEAIKSYGMWWHQAESTWFIETVQETKQILDYLSRYVTDKDRLIVIRVYKNWWAIGHTDEEYKWMKNRNF